MAPCQADEVRGLDRLDFRSVVREAKTRVFPAVVFIKVVREDNERGEKRSQEVSGSGVLISADGEVLSNWHVVDKATEVRCLLSDGRAFPAKVIGSDKDVDVALIKLDLGKEAPDLPFAQLGKSSTLTEGDFVMAMGAPWGMSRSVKCLPCPLPSSSTHRVMCVSTSSSSPTAAS